MRINFQHKTGNQLNLNLAGGIWARGVRIRGCSCSCPSFIMSTDSFIHYELYRCSVMANPWVMVRLWSHCKMVAGLLCARPSYRVWLTFNHSPVIFLPYWLRYLTLCPDPVWDSICSFRTNHRGILKLQLARSLTTQIVDTSRRDEIPLQGGWPHFTFQSEELSDLGALCYQAISSSEEPAEMSGSLPLEVIWVWQTGRKPRAYPEHVGGITYPICPGST